MTALQRILDRLPEEHREPFTRLVMEAGLREDSPDLYIIALEHEARWGAVEAMKAERHRLAGALDDHFDNIRSTLNSLPEAMKAAGAEIVTGLADSIATSTTTSIKAETIPMMQQIADVVSVHLDDAARVAEQTAKDTTQLVGAEIASAGARYGEASAALASSARFLRSWSSFRLAQVALGAIVAAGMFLAGTVADVVHTQSTCAARMSRVSAHLTLHDQNRLRSYVCAPLLNR